jgi:hypothetical protein
VNAVVEDLPKTSRTFIDIMNEDHSKQLWPTPAKNSLPDAADTDGTTADDDVSID